MAIEPRAISDETYGTASFVYEDEKVKWKVAKFDHRNAIAIRECGETIKFTSEHDASQHIKAMAARQAFLFLMDEFTKPR